LAENLLFFDAEEQQKRAEEDSKIQKKEERERERKKRKREEDKLMLVEANKAKTRGKGARRFSATNRLGGCALCVKCIDYVLVIPLMEFPLVNTKKVVGRRSKIPKHVFSIPYRGSALNFSMLSLNMYFIVYVIII
jgi:hypothetical protein